MKRDVALAMLAEEWREQGKIGDEPTLWDLAVALARAHALDDEDPRPLMVESGVEAGA